MPASTFAASFLTNGEIRTFAGCRQRWFFEYAQQLSRGLDYEGNLLGERRALTLGTAVHRVLEKYHMGEEWGPTVEKDVVTDLQPVVTRLMECYVEWYEQHPITGGVVVATEVPYAWELVPGVVIRGIIDGVVRNDDGTYSILEHKTTDSFTAAYFDKLHVDFQVRTYANALSKMERFGRPSVRSVHYNVLDSRPPAEPKINKNGRVSTAIGVRTTLEKYLRALDQCGIPHSDPEYAQVLTDLRSGGQFFRRQEYFFTPQTLAEHHRMLCTLAREMEAAPFIYRNPGACSDFGGCPYLDICAGRAEPGAPFYVRRSHRHPEFRGIDFGATFGYTDRRSETPDPSSSPGMSQDFLDFVSENTP